MIDSRILILGLSVALVLISLTVLVVAMMRASRSKQRDDVFASQGYFHDAEESAAIGLPVDPKECPFEEAEETTADWLSEPIRAGSWNPDVSATPAPVSEPSPELQSIFALEPEPEPEPALEPETEPQPER